MIAKLVNLFKILLTKINDSQDNEIESFLSLEQKAPTNLDEKIEMENLLRNR
ncbi:hypothetical protein [Halobacteriovorax sp. HLS]|uniref:hypothetical protein n=1 Tax=Halobacteriovorax sp. HLS TaxID=2234000 RepID=UPI0013E3C278|nr:hypothetical protein [Halobacteriovorax sp. HLS]